MALWLKIAAWQEIRGILEKTFKSKKIWSGQCSFPQGMGKCGYKDSGPAQVQTKEKLMEHFIIVLQVQFRGLFQMILVLGIGGSFPYGFHISVINYPSVVSSCLSEVENRKWRVWALHSPTNLKSTEHSADTSMPFFKLTVTSDV